MHNTLSRKNRNFVLNHGVEKIPSWSKSFRTRHRMALSFGRFQFFFFCCVGRIVIDVLSDFQLDSLTFVEVTPYCVHLSLCVVSIFHKKKCHWPCSNEFALNFVLKMDLTVRRLWKCWRSVSATILVAEVVVSLFLFLFFPIRSTQETAPRNALQHPRWGHGKIEDGSDGYTANRL